MRGKVAYANFNLQVKLACGQSSKILLCLLSIGSKLIMSLDEAAFLTTNAHQMTLFQLQS